MFGVVVVEVLGEYAGFVDSVWAREVDGVCGDVFSASSSKLWDFVSVDSV